MSTCITILIPDQQRQLLTLISRSPSCDHRLVVRARILLTCLSDPCNETVAQTCRTNRETVRKWRRRWLDAQPELLVAEAGTEWEPALRGALRTLLPDTTRGGHPPTFTPEQITQLMALACIKQTDVGREGTHWTPHKLADELQHQ